MEAAFAAIGRLWPGGEATVVELGGGITNRNYKVSVGDEVFVLRMGGAKTSLLGIDRAVEHAAGKRAFAVGVGPEVVRFEPEEGWLVARFIEGGPIPPHEMRRPATLARVAAALRAFHDSVPPIPGRFDAWAVVDGYRATAEAHGVKIPDEFADARELAERIRAALGPQPLVPCHNDLLNANFLDDPAPPPPAAAPPHEWGGVPPAASPPAPHEWGGVAPPPAAAVPHARGGIRIVDWEYAGMGDRFFDLANFSVNHEFDMEEDRRFLHAYFGEERERDLVSLRLMRYMSDFREAMWGVLQSGISDLDFDFTGYALKHFARMEGTASEPRFSSFLSSPSG